MPAQVISLRGCLSGKGVCVRYCRLLGPLLTECRQVRRLLTDIRVKASFLMGVPLTAKRLAPACACNQACQALPTKSEGL